MVSAAGTRDNDIAPEETLERVRNSLDGNGLQTDWGLNLGKGETRESAVLFLLTHCHAEDGKPAEPCLLLNKRSQKVLQPGDLCCPGGGIEPKDRLLSRVLRWPFSPLRQWPAWNRWKRQSSHSVNGLSMLFATALRESWEEMRLNPFKVAFMGPLPIQKLVMFKREIYPLVGWVPRGQTLVPNWEVERIVHLPLRRLLEGRHYARYRLTFDTTQGVSHRKEDFPCFIHNGRGGKEILWGATFRIAMDFLRLVFGFHLPDLSEAPVIHRRLDDVYLNGSKAHPPRALQEEREDDF